MFAFFLLLVQYWLPGAFAWGYIACTGTNFVIRAQALASCGLFPNNTVTEGREGGFCDSIRVRL